jgi:shikimate dehydrogenase
LHGCNTDGVGLLTDLQRLGATPRGKKILLVGAGGAAKGVAFLLLDAQCTHLRIVNRTKARAIDLQAQITRQRPQFSANLSAGHLAEVEGLWDIVINATSSSLGHHRPDLPDGLFAPASLAYDMMYAAQPTPFMEYAQQQGAASVSDGLGMLVAQAAASFAIWHRVEPDVTPVLTALRQHILAP